MSMAAQVRERPIIFSAAMVRALLAGAKTQTRRIVKAPGWWEGMTHYATGNVDERSLTRTNMVLTEETATHWKYCPHGIPGERLWVRESWGTKEYREYDPSGAFATGTGESRLVYRAGGEDGHGEPDGGRWRSPIYMPRWASRITLEITEVRVERLQDISEEDAIAEGIESEVFDQTIGYRNYLDSDDWFVFWDDMTLEQAARESYRTLWESIHGPGSWDLNPWLWALTFRRLEVAR